MNPPSTPIELPHLAATNVSGEDAESFLQAQFTADISRLADGEGAFSAYCDRRGNVLAVIRVRREGDGFSLVTAATLRGLLVETLGRYRLRARANFEPVALPVTGLIEGAQLIYALADSGAPAPGVDAAALAAWRARELRANIPWLGPETSGQFLPQMLGLESIGALSFRKGCFPGQEVIARVRYLGKLKRLPLIADFTGPLEADPGDEAGMVGESGPIGQAVLVDHAFDGECSACFLVAHNPEGMPVRALEIGARTYPVIERSPP